MSKSAAEKGFERDKNGVKRIVQNKTPIPGSNEVRNGVARFFVPAGEVPWSIEVTIADVTITAASGITCLKLDRVFCLDSRIRVTDNAEEPMETEFGPEV